MNVLSGLNQDFEDILVELARAGAEFIVVGAYALAFHGAPRTTGDIDIWIRPTRDNALKVHRALIAFGAPLASAGLTVDDLHHAGTVYQIGVEPRRIDILTKISGVTFDEAWPLAIEASIGEHQLRVLGRAALITNKRASGRLKDLADVERLEQVVPGSSDKAE
jgi:hypothetical protein